LSWIGELGDPPEPCQAHASDRHGDVVECQGDHRVHLPLASKVLTPAFFHAVCPVALITW
jgi:hypothetical protein